MANAPAPGLIIPLVSGVSRRPSNVPWVILSEFLTDDSGRFSTGGETVIVLAGATLNVGDAVYGSTAFTVNKSNVAGNQVLRAGIIVGGAQRSVESSTLEVMQRMTAAGGDLQGQVAGVLNDPVLLCIQGICYAVVDGAVAAWSQLKLSTTTAGQLTAATPGTDAGKIVAMAIDASTGANQIIRVLVTVA